MPKSLPHEPTFDEKLAKIQKYLPGGLTEKILSQRDRIEGDQRNGIMFNLGREYALYAEFYKRTGDRLKAQENLGKAIDIMKDCGADGWVKKYEGELAML
jgi:hypothetical protein